MKRNPVDQDEQEASDTEDQSPSDSALMLADRRPSLVYTTEVPYRRRSSLPKHEVKIKSYSRPIYLIYAMQICLTCATYGLNFSPTPYAALFGRHVIVINMFVNILRYILPVITVPVLQRFFGLYRALYYSSLLLAIGILIVVLYVLPTFHNFSLIFPEIGMAFIIPAAGFLETCLLPFGAFLFSYPQEATELSNYFAIMYFLVKLTNTIQLPVSYKLQNTICFHYPCIFGVFVISLFASVILLILFVKGENYYRVVKKHNRIFILYKCIWYAIYKAFSAKDNVRPNLLLYADDKFSQSVIMTVKHTWNILRVFTPLCIFWMIYFLQFMECAEQGDRMDETFGPFKITPDDMSMIHQCLGAILIPLYIKYIYPWLQKRSILTRPLQKMVVGGFLVVLSCAASGILEIIIEPTYAIEPDDEEVQIRIYNGLPCEILVNNDTLEALDVWVNTSLAVGRRSHFTISMPLKCEPDFTETIQPVERTIFTVKYMALPLFVTIKRSKLQIINYALLPDQVQRGAKGLPKIRFFYNSIFNNFTREHFKNVSLRLASTESAYVVDFNLTTTLGTSDAVQLEQEGRYEALMYEDDYLVSSRDVTLHKGGVYALMVYARENGGIMRLRTITKPNSIPILFQLPQIILHSMGDIMFTLGGQEFAFTQAEPSLEPYIYAVWKAVIAMGAILILLLGRMLTEQRHAFSFFLYFDFMSAVMAIFVSLVWHYQYVEDY